VRSCVSVFGADRDSSVASSTRRLLTPVPKDTARIGSSTSLVRPTSGARLVSACVSVVAVAFTHPHVLQCEHLSAPGWEVREAWRPALHGELIGSIRRQPRLPRLASRPGCRTLTPCLPWTASRSTRTSASASRACGERASRSATSDPSRTQPAARRAPQPTRQVGDLLHQRDPDRCLLLAPNDVRLSSAPSRRRVVRAR
jgi:hypothetical protein